MFCVEFVDSRFQVLSFLLVFKAKIKAATGRRVMVAYPKIGSKKAHSEQNEAQLQVANVEAIGAKRRRIERQEV